MAIAQIDHLIGGKTRGVQRIGAAAIPDGDDRVGVERKIEYIATGIAVETIGGVARARSKSQRRKSAGSCKRHATWGVEA